MDQSPLFNRAFKTAETWKDFETAIYEVMAKYLKVDAKTISELKRQTNLNRQKFLEESFKLFEKHQVIFSKELSNDLLYIVEKAATTTDSQIKTTESESETWTANKHKLAREKAGYTEDNFFEGTIGDFKEIKGKELDKAIGKDIVDLFKKLEKIEKARDAAWQKEADRVNKMKKDLIDTVVDEEPFSEKWKKVMDEANKITFEDDDLKFEGKDEWNKLIDEFEKKPFYSSGYKGSKYFRVKGSKDELIRLSDHWGNGIRSCDWTLDGKGNINAYNDFEKSFKFGKIRYDELFANDVEGAKQFAQFQKENIEVTENTINEDVESIKMTTINLLGNQYSTITRMVASNISKLEKSEISFASIRKETLKQLSKIASKGTPVIIDKAGRRLDIVNYTEMTTRANYKKLFNDTQDIRYESYNIDYVTSNVLGDSSTICEPFQGGVYSRGEDPKGQYPPSSVAEDGGHTTHINCRHFWFPYIPNVSVKPEPISSKTVKHNRAVRQKQRYNERQIRSWKRQNAVNPSEYNKNKVSQWQARQRGLIKAEPQVARQYEREQI